MRYHIIFALAAVLSACSSLPKYHPASSYDASGFSDQKLTNNQFRVTFQGDASTPRHKVEDFLLFRAAELTQENGFDYFVMEDKSTSEKTTIQTIRHPSSIGRYSHYWNHDFYDFTYSTYGYNWGVPYGGDTQEYTRYSATAYIQAYKGTAPAENVRAFNAKEIIESLNPIKCWKTEPHDEEKCKLSHSPD